MTDAQIYQIFGIGLSAMGVAWVINGQGLKQTLKDIAGNKGVLLTLGSLTLVAGYLIVSVHKTSSALIIFLGWVSLLKGLGIILVSSSTINLATLYSKLRAYYSAMPWLILVFGLILLYLGFLA